LPNVAEKIYVSPWHLSKLLHKTLNQSFLDILHKAKINASKELLKLPHMSMSHISEQVGFIDPTHFSKVFKKIEGITAAEYRNQVR